MSQQQLMPDPQSSQASYQAQSQGRQSLSGIETDVRPYNWPQRSRGSDLPKSDHPSTFEDSLLPYSYPAQDQVTSTQQSNSEESTRWQQQARTYGASIGRGTFTGTYQSYSQYNPQQQIPWWTQPQENTTDSSKWINILLLTLILLVSVPVLCSIGTAFVSIVFLFSLLPVLLAFAPIAFFLLIPLLRVLGPDSQDDRQQRSSYDQSWWW